MRSRVTEILESRGLVSVMNNTAWSELRSAITTELPWAPAYQMKSLLSDQPDPRNFDPAPSYHGDWTDPLIWQDTLEIEWMRLSHCYAKHRGQLIAPEIVSLETELRELLNQLNAPRIYSEDSTMIFGYIDSTSRLEPNRA